MANLIQTREAFALQNSRVGSCGLWFESDSTPDFSTLEAIATKVHQAFEDSGLLACFASEVSFIQPSAQLYDWDPPDKVVATSVDAKPSVSAAVGTVTSVQSLPADVACVQSLYSAEPGPRGRGRAYFPPFDVGSLGATGFFSSGYTTEIYDVMTRWIDGVQDVDATALPVVVSRKHQAAYLIVNRVVGTEPDTQRRRGARQR